MPKKCPPGVFCIENMTLFLLFVFGAIILYLLYSNISINKQLVVSKQIVHEHDPLRSISTRHDVFNDPYAPPIKHDAYFRSDSGDIRGIPVNIETRRVNSAYNQMGILTSNNGDNLILPLMGRLHMSGRDKWQYYTISNTGSLNTKLPVKVNGRSCSGEYGCDPIMNGDTVYVEGYKENFNATVYETGSFHYLPF